MPVRSASACRKFLNDSGMTKKILPLILLAVSCAPRGNSDSLSLKDYEPVSVFILEEHHPSQAKFPVIDAHTHPYAKDEAGIREWVKVMEANNIEISCINTYSCGDEFERLANLYTSVSDKFVMCCGFDMSDWGKPGFQEKALADLERCHELGAKGVGELGDKGFGEAYCMRAATGTATPTGHLNDPAFAPLLEKCGEYGMPVNIHLGDPIWMYEPMDAHNDGYMNAEHWKIDLSQPGILNLDELVATLEECCDKHPNTTFIAAHFLNYSHDYAFLGAVLDRHPNLYLDNAARHQETCVTPRATRAFYEKYQDRIVFGTDNTPQDGMYKDVWRILETEDEHFYLQEQSYHWPMQGIGLPEEVLRKVYHDNAKKLFDI